MKTVGAMVLIVIAVLVFLKFQNPTSSTSNTSKSSGLTNSIAAQVAQSSNVSLKNNSDNPTVLVGANNSGNVAVLKDSPNSPVTQTIINPLPEPTILKTNLIALNEPYESGYRTKFSVTIVNSRPISTNDSVRFQYKYPKNYNISEPRGQRDSVNSTTLNDGVFYDRTSHFTFYTSEKVQESDFSFWVETTPLKNKRP